MKNNLEIVTKRTNRIDIRYVVYLREMVESRFIGGTHVMTLKHFQTYREASEFAGELGRFLGIGWDYEDSPNDFDADGNRIPNY